MLHRCLSCWVHALHPSILMFLMTGSTMTALRSVVLEGRGLCMGLGSGLTFAAERPSLTDGLFKSLPLRSSVVMSRGAHFRECVDSQQFDRKSIGLITIRSCTCCSLCPERIRVPLLMCLWESHMYRSGIERSSLTPVRSDNARAVFQGSRLDGSSAGNCMTPKQQIRASVRLLQTLITVSTLSTP